MKIFLVEDDITLNDLITNNLEALGYCVKAYTDGKEAFEALTKTFDIYLVDINLPNINGLELVKQIKLYNSNAKIFIISGDTKIDTILQAYDLGCDDYIKKPFDIREVVAKINHSLINSSKVIQLSKSCIYDPLNKILFYNDSILQITNKETLLLDILIYNIGAIVSNEQIEAHVWGETVGTGYVRQLISKLRKSLPCDIIANHAANGYGVKKYVHS